MPSPSATVTVNGQPIATVGTSGANVSPGSTVTIKLASSAGLNFGSQGGGWQISCTGTDNFLTTEDINNTLSLSGYPNFTATFTAPEMDGYRGAAMQFTSIVNAGLPNQDMTTIGIWVLNSNGTRLFFGPFEGFESNATVGCAADLDAAIAIGFGSYNSLEGDVVGLLVDNTVIGLQGRPVSSADPTSGYVLTWNGSEWIAEVSSGSGFTAGKDLSGTSTDQTVIGIQGVSVSTNSVANDGYGLVSNSGTWKPQGVITTLNVKNFGAKGDGTTDDTAAIQACINQVSGADNTNVSTIYFPIGTYVISETLNYVGSVGNGIHMVGDFCTAIPEGTILLWNGGTGVAEDGYMMTTYGANQSLFENICWNGNNKAFTCLWMHTNQYPIGPIGGSPSSGITFRKCVFMNATGQNPQGTYAGTQGTVMLGDMNNNEELELIKFVDCLFGTTGFNGADGGTFACVNILGGANTTGFYFENCLFGTEGMNNGIFAWYSPAGPISLIDCGFADVATVGSSPGACINLGFGNANVTLLNCGCQNAGLPSPYTGTGYLLYGYDYNQVEIYGGEYIMDCINNPNGALIDFGGKLVIEGAQLDASGEISDNVGCIQLNNTSLDAGISSVAVRNCSWNLVTQQIPIQFGAVNLTLYNNGVAPGGMGTANQIILENNYGSDGPVPNLYGASPQLFSLALPMADSLPTSIVPYVNSVGEIYVGMPRITTSAFTVTYTAFSGVSSTSHTFSNIYNLPQRTKIMAVIVDVTTAFAGTTTCEIEIGDSQNGVNFYILNHSIKALTTNAPIGAVSGDLGTGLADYVQDGYFFWYPSSATFTFTFTTTGGNLSALSAGSLNVYITTESLS